MAQISVKTFFVAALLLFTLYLLANAYRQEGFGTSPGTMTQLSTSHVPTEEDYLFYKYQYPKILRREIAKMTESDPGELRPWVFPWYGRGVTLVV